MVSSTVLSSMVLALFAINTAASSSFLISTLPKCWRNCIAANKDGRCDSGKCICHYSTSGTFLPDTVTCARTKCDVEDWTVDVLLLPLQAYCASIGKRIPASIISSAECEATATSTLAIPVTSTRYARPTKSVTSQEQGIVTETETETEPVFASTITQTTTNEDGETLVIIVPVDVQLSTTISGDASTTKIPASSSTTTSSSIRRSGSASPSPTFSTLPPTTTPVPQRQSGSATSSSKKPERTETTGNGTPFENMQAAADRRAVKIGVLGIAWLAGMVLRV